MSTPRFGRSWAVIAGFLALVACALAAEGCSGGCPAPNPGMCAPNLTCVDGFRQTGGASCENGGWVCAQVACTSDSGTD